MSIPIIFRPNPPRLGGFSLLFLIGSLLLIDCLYFADSGAHQLLPTTQLIDAEKAIQPIQPAASSESSEITELKRWKLEIQKHLRQYIHYPASAHRNGEAGVSVVRAVIDRNGHLVTREIQQSSGIASLDREAMQVFKRAEPLPIPPENVLKNNKVTIILPITFKLN
ncbi:energy transducer TonB [Xenorhabdus sp. PB30.3]|uniref:energy transducer TonB family protein n=1 Tax=Xenorhabdus sp. PB30.3 TaxID=2788941 RepID=UPI001E2FCB75|nr:energy transducer TonB [Xenorhabdus sp. PB30.3]MCC8380645.1 energy transducer TonB [Xenorhabdus sp. PB30.3]